MRRRLLLLAAVPVVLVTGAAAAAPGTGLLRWEPTQPYDAGSVVSLELDRSRRGLALVSGLTLTSHRTADAGFTWTAAPVPANIYEPFRVLSATVAVARSGNGDVARTADAGRSWHVVNRQPAGINVLTLVDGSADGRTVYGGRYELYRLPTPGFCEPWQGGVALEGSGDGGRRWRTTRLAVSGAPVTTDVYDHKHAALLVHEYADGQAVTGGCAYAPVKEWVFVTHDGGARWRAVRTAGFAPTGYTTALRLLTPTRLLLGQSDGSTFVSPDDGRSWQPGARLGAAGYVAAFDFVGRTGYALTDAGIWRTSDLAATWTHETSVYDATGAGYGDIATGDGTTGIAAGQTTLSARQPTSVLPAPFTGGGAARPLPVRTVTLQTPRS